MDKANLHALRVARGMQVPELCQGMPKGLEDARRMRQDFSLILSRKGTNIRVQEQVTNAALKKRKLTQSSPRQAVPSRKEVTNNKLERTRSPAASKR